MNRATLIAIAVFAALILINIGVFGYLSFGSLSEKMVTEKLVAALNEAQVVLRQEREKQALSGLPGGGFLMRKLAVRLSSYEMVQAILLVDENGNVIERREVRGRLTAWALTDRVPSLQTPAEKKPAREPEQPEHSDFQPVFPTDMLQASTAEEMPQQGQRVPWEQRPRMPRLDPNNVNAAGIVRSSEKNPNAGNPFEQSVLAPQTDGEQPGTRLAIEYNAEALQREVDSLRDELNRKLLAAIFISLLLLGTAMAYVVWAHKRNQALRIKSAEADRLAYLGTLASGLAHEIRNPLNAMNMNVQLIQEELEEPEHLDAAGVGEMLESTRNEVGRLESMVSAFLSYSRPPNIEQQPTQINDLVARTLKFLQPEINQRGVILRTSFDENLPEIPADESQLRQALINIVQNGLQVLQRGQHLDVSTRLAGGDKLLITVTDEGPGISDEELKNIFKVFYSTKRGGTGLGLATAQRIVESHHGGIKVDSEVGKGSTFTFVLPIDNQSPEQG